MKDPHSYTDLEQAHTDHIRLSLYVDFQDNLIEGSALFTLRTPHTAGHLFLDTRRINVRAVHLPKDHADAHADVPFELDDAHEDSIKGTLLKLSLPPGATQFVLTFATQPRASSALQWLQPAQTAGKRQPYAYTQCQSIHARSIFPCQDTPSVRIRYTALLNIPSEMTAVMSAGRLKRCPPQSDAECLGASSRWMSTGRVVEHFDMPQPIPPYLFAFAIGDIVSVDAGPRTKIYSEPSPVLEGAAAEFKDVEELIRQGESLFGDYVWDRFDLLVLPPSFPFGGMENPRMVFLTPAVVTGEGSGAQVVAHELAHSWTGNLITNASNNDFWLNEGFTTYAERRIVEAVEGKDKAALNIGLGCASLRDDVGRFKDNLEFTKLRTNQEGIDPDEVYSCVPYEKGFQFLWRIERQVGRAAFDIFLKKYIETFKFQSIDTETFLGFLTKNLPGIEKDIDLDMWVDGTGLPPDIMNPDSPLYTEILSASSEYVSHGVVPPHDQTKTWMGQEWNLFLEHLPRNLSSSQIQTLDQNLRFTTSNNLDVKVAFLTIVAYSGYEPFFEEVEKCLKSVGRLMYLRPLYTGLLQSGSKGKEMAKRVYEDAKDSYHPIAQGVVETLLVKFA